MSKTTIECPHCFKEVNVETEMYMDGDVCYDLHVDEKDAEEVEDFNVQLTYQCLGCKDYFGLSLDDNYWGYEDIPVYANAVEYEKKGE